MSIADQAIRDNGIGYNPAFLREVKEMRKSRSVKMIECLPATLSAPPIQEIIHTPKTIAKHEYRSLAWFAANQPSLIVGPKRPTLKSTIMYVEEKTGISVQCLKSNKRTRNIVVPRQEFCWLAYEYTGCSLTEIARFLGGRDHTTILHSVKRHEANIRNGRAMQ